MKKRTASRQARVRRNRARVAAPTVLALLAGGAFTEGTAHAVTAHASVSGSGITAIVNADGSYTIATTQPAAWTFSGSVGHSVTSQSTVSGSDAIGAYQEIDFSYTDSVARSASIRVYQNTPNVLFSSSTHSSAANSSSAGTPFP
jgi:hypothetical protein